MDLKTTFLGIDLKNPFIVGSSPLTNSLDRVKRMEDAGAAALVMHSLFEEQIIHEADVAGFGDERLGKLLGEDQQVFPPAKDFPTSSEAYLKLIQRIKDTTDLPVFASLNGVSEGVWIEYARRIEEAGADALELNLYSLPTDNDDSSDFVEKRLVEIVDVTRNSVSIPIAVKISPHYTSVCNFAQRLEYAGANGLVLFNQLFQPDIDYKRKRLISRLHYTQPVELLERLRWVSILHNRLKMDIAASGGVHSGEDAYKAVLCGADVVQVVSPLLRHGVAVLQTMIQDFEKLCEESGESSLCALRGSLGELLEPDPSSVERASYLRILQGWKPEQD
ncbi:MAG: dihydroorotate dehydrogenase-like protein [Puniceicoccaceae bacterium]